MKSETAIKAKAAFPALRIIRADAPWAQPIPATTTVYAGHADATLICRTWDDGDERECRLCGDGCSAAIGTGGRTLGLMSCIFLYRGVIPEAEAPLHSGPLYFDETPDAPDVRGRSAPSLRVVWAEPKEVGR